MRITSPLLLALLILSTLSTFAQEGADSIVPRKDGFKINVGFDARVDFDYNMVKDEDNNAGFHGRYLDVWVNGQINDHFAFSFRQRLNKFGEMKNDVFGATDWVYVDYKPTDSWTISAGKQVVAVGGYEYDASPIDVYFSSIFWRNYACYQFGVSGAHHFKEGKHTILAQVTNSPYATIGSNCFAYNLMWMGNVGPWHPLWSTNLMGFKRAGSSNISYAHYISLGNRFSFPGGYVDLDLMNRYSGHQKYLFGDFSLVGKLCYSINQHFDIFAKGGYECYRPVIGERPTIDKPFYGGGVEYFPLKKSRNLRLHAVADMSYDIEGRRTTQISAGVKWAVDIYTKK